MNRRSLVAALGLLIGSAGMSSTTLALDWGGLSKGLGDLLGGGGSAGATSLADLSQGQVADGLKEALANGIETAIATLGKTDGFLGNELVRIALPESMTKIAKTARKIGGGSYVDAFETTMNRAAEQAVPEAAGIFADAIRAMSIEDAKAILTGPEDAATNFFRDKAGPALVERFRPIVESATAATGVTSAYKDLVGQAAPVLSMLGKGDATDVDGYVTNEAVNGLFTMIAGEEKRIRENPVARTSDLLKTVFGATR
ncbi:MAG: DUF4197 domain-containing protein [Chromatiales bacterium]|nr:DUF4197 domain-containing protein [Chromatiales bacterium]